MNHFSSVRDVPDLKQLLETALAVKQHPHAWHQLGKHKTLGLVFFNSSLRTRMSSQRAAYNLGMNTIVLNVSSDSWQLEFADGAVMRHDKAEHIRDAAPVMGQYCDLIGIRAFAGLQDREADYREEVLEAFKQYAGVPIISLESATLHPLQSFADLITIEMHKRSSRPRVVLSWAPHPRALPQAVANSFAEWMLRAEVELVITHPEGYELDPRFTQGAEVEYDQRKAFEGADFVYAKNWSSYTHYGQILTQSEGWMIDAEKMALTRQAFFMHCLPVRRNVVVADAVIDSPQSLATEQAANRVVSMQTVLKSMLEQGVASN
ncbi:MAG: N-acetylornithine carbamoyltransferase [Bacteroidetes bacterium]|nr:MAG: N-acetylornithine carbamoyltransferase [Bacteroidota bacterium]